MHIAPWALIAGLAILAMLAGLLVAVSGLVVAVGTLTVVIAVAASALFFDCVSRRGLAQACVLVALGSLFTQAPVAATIGEGDPWMAFLSLVSLQILLFCGVIEIRLSRERDLTNAYLARTAATALLFVPFLLLVLVDLSYVAPAGVVTAIVYSLIAIPEKRRWLRAGLWLALVPALLWTLTFLGQTISSPRSTRPDDIKWTRVAYALQIDLTGNAEAPDATERLTLEAIDIPESAWLGSNQTDMDDEKKKLAVRAAFTSWFSGWTVSSLEITKQLSAPEPLWSGRASVERLNAPSRTARRGWLSYHTEFEIPDLVADNKSQLTLLLVARKFAPVKHNFGGEFQETVLADGSIGKVVRADHLNSIDSTVRVLHVSRALQNPMLSWIAFLGTWDAALYVLAGLSSAFSFFLLIALNVIKESRFAPVVRRLLTRLRVIPAGRSVQARVLQE